MSMDQLIKLGKLSVGSELTWSRRSSNMKHKAKVLAGGKLQTADGLIHRTPSGAARHLNNNKPVDGWIVWKLSSGKSLGSLR